MLREDWIRLFSYQYSSDDEYLYSSEGAVNYVFKIGRFYLYDKYVI